MDWRCCSTRCLSAAPSFFCRLAPSASTASSTLFRTLASLVAWSGIVVVVPPVNSRVNTALGSYSATFFAFGPLWETVASESGAPFGVAGVTPTSSDLNGAPAEMSPATT